MVLQGPEPSASHRMLDQSNFDKINAIRPSGADMRIALRHDMLSLWDLVKFGSGNGLILDALILTSANVDLSSMTPVGI